MIYLRVKTRVTARAGQPLLLGDVADVLCDASLRLDALPVELPRGEGIWPLDALRLVVLLQQHAPRETVNVLGDGTGWLHRQSEKPLLRRGARVSLAARTAVVCLLLFAGSALTITWFHTDVNMAQAQGALFAALAGREAASPLWIALPYALGVGLGAALFYLLPGRGGATPLSVKLREYAESAERNARTRTP